MNAIHAVPRHSPTLGMSPRETKRYSILRAIAGAADGKLSGLELEAHRAVEAQLGPVRRSNACYVPLDALAQRAMSRDLSASTLGAGGALVPTNNMSFIDALRPRSIVMAAGATRMTGLRGNVSVPRQTTAGTAGWLSTEATAATESDQVFGQMILSPKNVAAYTEISRQLLIQSDPSAENIVMNDLAQQVALAVDLAAVNGSAASGQPRGILNTAGIGSVSGTSLAYAGLMEFQTDVANSNALINANAAAYVTTPAVASLLAQRQRFTGTDSPLWQGNLIDGTVVGARAFACSNMPADTMIFGDWSQLVVGEWGPGLEISTNPYADFRAGVIGVRAWYTVDVQLRHAAAFSAATAIT